MHKVRCLPMQCGCFAVQAVESQGPQRKCMTGLRPMQLHCKVETAPLLLGLSCLSASLLPAGNPATWPVVCVGAACTAVNLHKSEEMQCRLASWSVAPVPGWPAPSPPWIHCLCLAGGQKLHFHNFQRFSLFSQHICLLLTKRYNFKFRLFNWHNSQNSLSGLEYSGYP